MRKLKPLHNIGGNVGDEATFKKSKKFLRKLTEIVYIFEISYVYMQNNLNQDIANIFDPIFIAAYS